MLMRAPPDAVDDGKSLHANVAVNPDMTFETEGMENLNIWISSSTIGCLSLMYKMGYGALSRRNTLFSCIRPHPP